MANAMVLGFAYNAPSGDSIIVTAETVIAGSDVAQGSVQVGLEVVINPVEDTPSEIGARVAAAVRAWAAVHVANTDVPPGHGVTIATNDLVMPTYVKG